MSSLAHGARVILTDFGHARYLEKERQSRVSSEVKYRRMTSYVGTLDYAAPEIHLATRAIPEGHGYSKAVDMWSIGCITATLLSGDIIFVNPEDPHYQTNPRSVIVGCAALCDLSFLDDPAHETWRTVSPHAKSFIKGLLILDENNRMTAPDALLHPWFSRHTEDFENLYQRSIENWSPRAPANSLVERIHEPKRQLNKTPRPVVDDASPPCFSSGSDGTNGILTALTTSAHFRANTPLPSIDDEYHENQFASQIPSPPRESELDDETRWNDSVPLDTDAYGDQSSHVTYRHPSGDSACDKDVLPEDTFQFAQGLSQEEWTNTQQYGTTRNMNDPECQQENAMESFGGESCDDSEFPNMSRDQCSNPNESELFKDHRSVVPETPPSDAFSDTYSWNEELQCPD